MRSTRSFLFSLLFSVTCLLLFSQCITTVGFNEPYIPVDGGGEITEAKNEPTREIRSEPRSEPLHERTPEPVVIDEPSLADAPDSSAGDDSPDAPDTPDMPDVPDTNGQCQVYSKPCTLPGQGECAQGVQLCQADKTWGQCVESGFRGKEVCDKKDNDCDGQIDEECCKNCCFPTLLDKFDLPTDCTWFAMHPDGKEIASQCGKYVKFFSLATKQETSKILLDAGEYFRYHPDGNSLFVTLGKKVPFPTDRPADVLYLYDKKAGKVTQTFQIPGKELIDRTITYRSAAISKNGQYIALATQPSTIRWTTKPVEYTLQVYVFDTIQGTTYKTITLKHKTTGGMYASDLIRSMTFTNNNKTLILGVNEDGGIQFWDLPSVSKQLTLPAPKTPTIIYPNPIKLLLSPSETTLYVVEERGQIRRYDIPSKTLTKKYFIMPEDTCYKRPAPCEHRGLGDTGSPHAASLAWSPDGQWLAFHYGYWAGLNIFDYSTMSLYHTQQEDTAPSKKGEYEAKVRTQSKALWTKDGKWLFVASRKYQKNANIWRYQCK